MWAIAWRAAVSPMSIVDGVTVIVRKVGLTNPWPPHPAIVINRAPKSQRCPRDILSVGMLCFLTFGFLHAPHLKPHLWEWFIYGLYSLRENQPQLASLSATQAPIVTLNKKFLSWF